MLGLYQVIPLAALLPTVALASIGPVADLHIVNKNISPDGFSRDTVLAGGTFPGPLITANRGQSFSINVFDDLTDSTMDVATSIHWHGLFQHTTNWADGPAFVNQCPIIPGNSFRYTFSSAQQYGTYWYHSHLSAQYCDGLRGPLVIYDPLDPYKYLYDVDDESTVITLADWYHYVSTNPPAGPPSPSSTLINGLGRYQGGPNSTLAVVGVTQGKRYRFRLVSMSCDSNFVFSIDQHKMTIIEVDGNNVNPLIVDSVQVFAGQRYSIVVNANQKVDNYWIRAAPNTVPPGFDNARNSAIFRYKGAPTVDPTTPLVASTQPMVETNLHARENPSAPGKPVPGGADINYTLDVTFNGTAGLFEVNGTSFSPPTVPVLLQILSGAKKVTDLLPKGSIYELAPYKSVELVIPGGAIGGGHPVHLHGHSFSVVRSAGNSSYNYANPVRRDVVNIGTSSSDQTTIRFYTDNPGPWFLHCHIDWHLTAGFAAVFAEDIQDTPLVNPTPAAWKDLCPDYNNANAQVKVNTLPKKLQNP
ncbi:laccse sensu stricto [Heterobasidion irregulare TC 32-1]|uniref:Laccse sensu stricto n=1 Tax=Heterobasidion irregulare (strain TC 32-1) TaxID=747525 RepID=W4KI25_HETIT|nr:laccse sensu stricto [Heterobasidion irregulare TC 32-1]ETW84726.1 laccse sensu stricto [Heterobasidion irregulare TC 32-1]